MATNRIDSLDPALIRPGRIDRKIEFPLPNEATKKRIFQIHTSLMQLSDNVVLDEFILAKDDLSGADIKVIFFNLKFFVKKTDCFNRQCVLKLVYWLYVNVVCVSLWKILKRQKKIFYIVKKMVHQRLCIFKIISTEQLSFSFFFALYKILILIVIIK